MMRMSRCKGVASVFLMALCIGTTGCLNNGLFSPSGQMASMGQPGYPNGLPTTPAYPHASGHGKSPGMIQQTSYPPRPNFPGQPPMGGQPDEVHVEQPGVGMPMPGGMMPPTSPPLPRELGMVAHPPHRVAPPDILHVEALRLVPKGPYKLSAMEVLQIEVTDALPRQEIKGLYMISPEGSINLGHSYGSVRVFGLTVDQAQTAIRNHLGPIIKNANVNVALVQMRGMQNIRGEHVVRPDGTISLGMYGSVFVAGMNLGQVKCVIENHLAAYLVDPQVSVDVFAYNSRKIYIIADGAGYGQQVIALPATGGETVLDAISRVQGLPQVASLKKIWVARPAPAGHPCSQVLPVDWKAITQAGNTATNYQLFPGDRIYIHSDAFIAAYNYIDKMVAPIERVMGLLFLSSSTINSFRTGGTGNAVIIP